VGEAAAGGHDGNASALYEALAELTEEAWQRLRDGDADALATVLTRRDAILGRIRRSHARAEPAVLQRIVEANQRIIEALQADKAGTARELEELAAVRRSLESYRGAPPAGPRYVDRMS
jgi:hypothetical protein